MTLPGAPFLVDRITNTTENITFSFPLKAGGKQVEKLVSF